MSTTTGATGTTFVDKAKAEFNSKRKPYWIGGFVGLILLIIIIAVAASASKKSGSTTTSSSSSASSSSGGGTSNTPASAIVSQSFDATTSLAALSPTWTTVFPSCNSGVGTNALDNTVSFSGTSSLKTTGGSTFCDHIFLSTSLASVTGDLFVRFRIRLSAAIGSGHVTFLAMTDSLTGKNVRMGGQSGVFMFNREVDDQTLPILSPTGIGLSVSPQANTWYCFEFAFQYVNGKTNLTTWINGNRIDGLSTGNTAIDANWTPVTKYSLNQDLKLGFEDYGSGTAVVTWFDDVVVSSSRIGC
eukprot:TRINITY_DN78267_c0_g1_i1.p1 TRINITY_DN78267_c0_g1~~TRINITY_DN78267_c0_g1_i1.p1  ORF type:complete len:315 (-),score=97.89 TRINITY_DN78267_c0_g1_i1:60-962(-)